MYAEEKKRGYRAVLTKIKQSSEADCEYPLDPNGGLQISPPDPGSDRVKYK